MIGERIFCGLDIGLQKTKASLVRAKRNGVFELLGSHETMTRGLKKASISDLSELVECIHHTMKELSKKTSLKLKDIHLGVGGNFVEPRYSGAVIPLLDRGGKPITRSDIKNVNEHARLLGIKMEEEMLHDFPQHYVVDDTINTTASPFGLFGRKLGVHSLLLVSKVSFTSNLIRAVNQVGLEVIQLSFTSLCSAQAILSSGAKEGCVFIDAGANVTSILIFKDGILRQVDIIHLGGENVTKAIAQSFHLPFDLAEDIKKSYAAASLDDAKKSGEILIKKESEYIPIKKEAIFQATETEIARLVSTIENTIQSSGLTDKLKGGIVMTGGGSLLPGLIERVEKVTNLSARIGKIAALSMNSNDAVVFSAAAGLAQLGFGKPTYGTDAPPPKDWFHRLSGRAKDLYEEYF